MFHLEHPRNDVANRDHKERTQDRHINHFDSLRHQHEPFRINENTIRAMRLHERLECADHTTSTYRHLAFLVCAKEDGHNGQSHL